MLIKKFLCPFYVISSFDATVRVRRVFHPAPASRRFASHVFLVTLIIMMTTNDINGDDDDDDEEEEEEEEEEEKNKEESKEDIVPVQLHSKV